jgi:alpha-mannosidase
MHDFVALCDAGGTRMALGRGIRSYTSDGNGLLALALRRSVEWIARESLTFRHGDAGPAMYVPGARCERTVHHELGFAVLDGSATTTDMFRVSEGFHQPPLIVEVGTDAQGSRSSWSVFSEDLPLTGVERVGDETVIRVFNPDGASASLVQSWERRSVLGEPLGRVDSVASKAIVDLVLPIDPPTDAVSNSAPPEMTVYGVPEVRAGHNRSRPDQQIMAGLEARRVDLAEELADVEHRLADSDGDARYRLTHRRLVIERERAELALSLELNRRLAGSTDVVSIPDEIDDVIAALGRELNTLRVDRRIYDYVVQSL